MNARPPSYLSFFLLTMVDIAQAYGFFKRGTSPALMRELSDQMTALKNSRPYVGVVANSDLTIYAITQSMLDQLGKDQGSATKYIASSHAMSLEANLPPYVIAHEFWHAYMTLCRVDFNSSALRASKKHPTVLSLPYKTSEQRKRWKDAVTLGRRRTDDFERLLNAASLTVAQHQQLEDYTRTIDEAYSFQEFSYTISESECSQLNEKFKFDREAIERALLNGLHQFWIGAPEFIINPTTVEFKQGSIQINGYLSGGEASYRRFIVEQKYLRQHHLPEYRARAVLHPEISAMSAEQQTIAAERSYRLEVDAYINQNDDLFLATFFPELQRYHRDRCGIDQPPPVTLGDDSLAQHYEL
jgi:hypothetical protein